MTLEEFKTQWNDGSDRLIVHTSGSTGTPKPLLVEKKRMEASARITCSFLGLKTGDTALLCMPLDYIAGKMVVVRSIVCGLHLISVPPSGHPLRLFINDEKYCGEKIDFAAMVPMQVYNSMQNPAELKLLRNIRHLIIGGGSVDEEMAAQLRNFPNAVWSTYGMTETLSHIALRRLSGSEASEWYTPFDTVNVSLSNEGCLVIDAPQVCPDILVTNDRAEIAPDGRRFRILGRKDNVIDSGGIKIQIEEVEKALHGHLPSPYMITKATDKKFGESVVLLIVGNPSDIEQIKNICHTCLTKYWQPKQILCVGELPMTETGKPARKQAEMLAERILADSDS